MIIRLLAWLFVIFVSLSGILGVFTGRSLENQGEYNKSDLAFLIGGIFFGMAATVLLLITVGGMFYGG